MSLRTPSFSTLYTTSANDLFADFFVLALQQAIYYDRGVGYFSSGWLRLAAQGIARFAAGVCYNLQRSIESRMLASYADRIGSCWARVGPRTTEVVP